MNYKVFSIILLVLLVPIANNSAFAHQVDSVGEYRIEIGWMSEPAFSKETNGIELFVSDLDPNFEAVDQEFDEAKGIVGLEKDLKIQLVYKTDKITLNLKPDHNVKGKYYTLVDPTIPGYFQVNVIGTIQETVVSLSLHAPKVDDRSFIEFPQRHDETILQEHENIQEQLENFDLEHENLRSEVNEMKNSIEEIKQNSVLDNIGFIGIGLGIAGIVMASIALSKKR